MLQKTSFLSALKKNTLKYKFFFISYLFVTFHISALDINTNVISLNIEKMPLLEVFSKIENKTRFNFFYKNDDINLNQKITINIEKVTIKQLLIELFKGRAIVFKIEESKIILKKYTASSYLIKGLILDKKTRNPIYDAHLLIDDKTEGILTDEQGFFEINFNALPVTLTMSHINYGKRTVIIDQLSDVTIALPPLINRLEAISINSKEKHKKQNKAEVLSKNVNNIQDKTVFFIMPGKNFHFSQINYFWDKSKGELSLEADINKNQK